MFVVVKVDEAVITVIMGGDFDVLSDDFSLVLRVGKGDVSASATLADDVPL